MMTNEEEQYVTLFCEGDGTVYTDSKGYPVIGFFQKERTVLEYIDSITENGHFYQDKNGVWRLMFNGSHCLPLLEIFSKHVAGKHFLERLNEVLAFTGMSLTAQHPLTLDGFVGFWDAEGSSSNIPAIFVSQKDREILNLITKMFGGGISHVKNNTNTWFYQWYLYGTEAHGLAGVILEKCHYPAKAERLRQNFEGPNHYELHKERYQTYRDTHKEEQKVRSNTQYAKQKAIREYIKAHPEVVERMEVKL